MKIKHTLLGLMMTSAVLFSCKDKDVTTPTEERIEENHPTDANQKESHSEDTLEVITDSVNDPNMEGQSDTHGSDTDAGR